MIKPNLFLIIFTCCYLLTLVFEYIVDGLNASHLKKTGTRVPDVFRGSIDENDLKKIQKYTSDNTFFGIYKKSADSAVFLAIIFSGILPLISGALPDNHFIFSGLCFFLVISIISSVPGLPFDYYHDFVIEKKHGFNTKTIGIWVSDIFKSAAVGIVVGGIILSAILALVYYGGSFWWIFAWAFFIFFQLTAAVLYPLVIAPLFNKFTPIENAELVRRIEALAEKCDLNIKGIYQMDASKRSRHTNAYFTGLGKSKRIVLYDSLLEAHDTDEIIAILAHEIGHMKHRHILKNLVFFGVLSFFMFYAASCFIKWELMYASFGFTTMPAYAGLFITGIICGPVFFLINPIVAGISRRFEKEADFYAYKLTGASEHLCNALKKIAKDNLSNLTPHPVYVTFHYSHPPLSERIALLESYEK